MCVYIMYIGIVVGLIYNAGSFFFLYSFYYSFFYSFFFLQCSVGLFFLLFGEVIFLIHFQVFFLFFPYMIRAYLQRYLFMYIGCGMLNYITFLIKPISLKMRSNDFTICLLAFILKQQLHRVVFWNFNIFREKKFYF